MERMVKYLTGEQMADGPKGAITSPVVSQIARPSTTLLAIILQEKGKLEMPAAGDPFASPVPTGHGGGGPPVVT
jgi:hypothetical protein